jgi:hypothetical protein
MTMYRNMFMNHISSMTFYGSLKYILSAHYLVEAEYVYYSLPKPMFLSTLSCSYMLCHSCFGSSATFQNETSTGWELLEII